MHINIVMSNAHSKRILVFAHPWPQIMKDISKRMYSLEDLVNARRELKYWQDRFANDTSNNPNKYHSQIKNASSEVRIISDFLKNNGTIERSDKEKMELLLNTEFPTALSKEVVEYKGSRYMKRFYPLRKSNSGKTIHEWGSTWEKLD